MIERTDDRTVSDVPADFTAAFGAGSGMGLVDSGEQLGLEFASTTMDQTPPTGACGPSRWCGGSTGGRLTMERIDPDLLGSDPAAWSSHDTIIRNGKSADGIALNGTPKARNSRNYYISQTWQLSSATTLTKAKSPYVITEGGLRVAQGVTLTVEPGVTVKLFTNTSDLIVDGTIKAIGTAAEPIVFTSFRDDEYGGDTNGDGAGSAPLAGEWRHIAITGASRDSEFAYVRVRYGGRWFTGQQIGHALLKVENASLTISNSTFERSFQSGIWLINSTSTVANSTIQENRVDALSYGILIQGGAPTIKDNTISGNTRGVGVESEATATVSGNTFRENSQEAIAMGGGTPTLSGNSALGNGINGVLVGGSLPRDYTFVKGLPYVFEGGLTLPSAKIFRAEPGVVFKGKGSASAEIDVGGTFTVAGSNAEPVVFTSVRDDEYGGDTNNDGATSTVPAAGDWLTLRFGPTATSSSVSHGLIRYGGAFARAGLHLNGTAFDISDTTIERNASVGLKLSNATSATSTLARLIVRDHQPTPGSAGATGLLLESGARAVLSGSMFSANALGISADASWLTNGGGNSFSGNTMDTFPPGLIP